MHSLEYIHRRHGYWPRIPDSNACFYGTIAEEAKWRYRRSKGGAFTSSISAMSRYRGSPESPVRWHLTFGDFDRRQRPSARECTWHILDPREIRHAELINLKPKLYFQQRSTRAGRSARGQHLVGSFSPPLYRTFQKPRDYRRSGIK